MRQRCPLGARPLPFATGTPLPVGRDPPVRVPGTAVVGLIQNRTICTFKPLVTAVSSAAQSRRYLRLAVRRRRAARDAVSSWGNFAAAIGEVCGARDWVEACTVALSAAVSKAPNRPGVPTGRHRRGLPAEMRLEGTN